MSWFLLTVISTFIYAGINHLDKIILSKYFHTQGPSTIVQISSFFALLSLPFLYFIRPDILVFGISNALQLTLIGAATAYAMFLYLKALFKDDASVVTAFFQLIPVFGYILGFIILHESVSPIKLFGAAITISGLLLLSLHFEKGQKIKIKKEIIWLMTGSSFVYALTDILYRRIATDIHFTESIFWSYLGFALFGLAIYILKPSARKELRTTLTENKRVGIVLSAIVEISYIAANMMLSKAFIVTPLIFYVLITNSFQPLIVFLLGIILTIVFPKIHTENMSKTVLIQRLIGILCTIIGSYFIL